MEPRAITIAVAANFTADPVKPVIEHLLGLFRAPHRVDLAGYNQVLRELIDPSGLFGQNRDGVNAALIRLADLGRPDGKRREAPDPEAIRRGAREIADLVSGYAQRAGAPPLLVMITPDPAALRGDAAYAGLTAEIEATFAAACRAAGAQVITSGDLAAIYPVADADDPAADVLAHIPYTPAMFAAIGAAAARKVRARSAPPYKVLALDCDNTIWTGVVGEDGPDGVIIDGGREALQRFAVAQHEAGMLICLCSKNVEEDVDEVFRRRSMPLRRDHVVAARVNWQPKSANLCDLAAELSLGLDAFVFADDSLVECAEVRAACPEVLTVHLPQDSAAAAAKLAQVWAFDRWAVTEEDRRRTEQYRQNAAREQTRRSAPSMAEFLASLGLDIRVDPPAPADMPRVSQLTFRTNQFNFTTRRRSEAEITESGLDALKVHVRDRFGDYGLVGVMLFGPRGDALAIDTFLLSCRVLQRGVEHRMLARLGEIALDRGLAYVEADLSFTAKNLPAQQFLRSVGDRFLTPREGGFSVRFPAAEAAALTYQPDAGAPPAEAADEGKPKASAAAAFAGQAEVIATIAAEFGTAEAIAARVSPAVPRRARPKGAPAPVAPRDEAERAVAAIVAEVLNVAEVGVTDDLFLDLGADSLQAVAIAARAGAILGREVQVVTVQEARTVERLTGARARVTAGLRSRSIHALRAEGSKRPLFLGRPATRSGGALSYVALARHLDPDRPIYVFQNRAMLDEAEPYRSIEDMASEYIAAMRSVQPEGPYLLAGWCLGGKTVFEMASRLAASGDEVSRLVLLDTAAPGGLRDQASFLARHELTRLQLRLLARFPRLAEVFPQIRVARARSQLRRFGVLAYYEPDRDDVALIQYAFPGRFDEAALRALPPPDRWQHVYDALRAGEPEAGEGDGQSALAVRRGYRYFAWDHRIDALYDPRRIYPGPVSMLTIRGGAAMAAGWRRLLASPAEVREFDVKGTAQTPDPHSAMMAEENVKLFAPDLDRILDGG